MHGTVNIPIFSKSNVDQLIVGIKILRSPTSCNDVHVAASIGPGNKKQPTFIRLVWVGFGLGWSVGLVCWLCLG